MSPARVAIVGAGWAGLAAAVTATELGHGVRLFEAARSLGGRARSLAVTLPDGQSVALDNGQHILIGAYVDTLGLMARLGVPLDAAFLRLPLTLQFPDGTGLKLPSWPAPLDAAAGILSASGWGFADKLSLLRASLRWQLAGFLAPPNATVAALCAGLSPRIRNDLVDPLCVAALNTPAERASAQVFLRVVHDSLFGRGHGGWGGSNLLLPRQALGELLPAAAAAWLQARGVSIATGDRIDHIARAGAGWTVDGEAFDAVVLATPPWEAARLVEKAGLQDDRWAAAARGLAFEAIATVYAVGGPRLAQPMVSLRARPDAPAQFVFDRGQLGGPAGLLAFVVSASDREREAIEAQVMAQAHALGWLVRSVQTVVEKRATFACLPGLRRPPLAIAPGLWACGDYVEGPYPATLEGAVRAGQAVARLLPAALAGS